MTSAGDVARYIEARASTTRRTRSGGGEVLERRTRPRLTPISRLVEFVAWRSSYPCGRSVRLGFVPLRNGVFRR